MSKLPLHAYPFNKKHFHCVVITFSLEHEYGFSLIKLLIIKLSHREVGLNLCLIPFNITISANLS